MKSPWKLRPIILAWIIPILVANFFLGVMLNYFMAKDNDNKRIQDHISQRRMDLIFLGNLPDLHTYFMDVKLSLKEEAEFVKEDVEGYLSNYLRNLKPSFPHDLSIVTLQGKELIRIKNGEITSERRDFAGSPYLTRFMMHQEDKNDSSLPILPESSWYKNSTLVDVFPIHDEINNKVIGGIIYEYNVPIKLLTKHTRNVLIFNLMLGLSIAVAASLALYFALGNIIKPLNRLISATQDILTGDLTKNIEAQGWGEMRLLATTFESMRRQLKKQFDQLEYNTRRLRAIIDFLPDATLIVDKDKKVIFWNRALEEMTGYSSETMMGKGDLEYSIPFYGKRESLLIGLALEEANKGTASKDASEKYVELKHDGNVLMGSAWCSTTKGESRLLSATASVLYDEKGEIWGAIESIRDMTDYNETLQERETLRAQLFQSQKMEAVGRLAGGVAHDFNNLLTAIMGYAEILKMKLRHDEELQKKVEMILHAANRAKSLTSQLLAFSRKQILQPQVIDLNDVVTSIDKMLRHMIGEDIELLTVLGSPLGPVKVDPAQIEQVIMNLAVNARDAMPQGGKLTIKTADIFLDETHSREHPEIAPGFYVLLAVSDTGTGIDEETLSRIFEPFFTTKGIEQGTGLGLSMVHGIITQSGGYIYVQSEQGKGTCFNIYLPRVKEVAEALTSSVSNSETSLGSETILVVEDNDSLRELVCEILQECGYTILKARHGYDGILVAEQHKAHIHLMVTDVVMPHMSGEILASRMATLRPQTKVLFMSGYIDGHSNNESFLSKGMAFLQKPFTPDVLTAKVREVLDTSQPQPSIQQTNLALFPYDEDNT